MKVEQILSLLQQEYGSPLGQTDSDPISVLVLTILSQNTSDTNSHRAFAQLLSAFSHWEALTMAPVDKIVASIQSGGLARVKAERLKAALQIIQQKRGSFDLGFLRSLPLDEAKAWLQQLPGVGAKTAACVLLFSLGKPALPVDTHVLRVARRLGLANHRDSPEKTEERLEKLVPSEDIYSFHILLIQHGRQICRSRMPLCQQCVLRSPCPKVGVEGRT